MPFRLAVDCSAMDIARSASAKHRTRADRGGHKKRISKEQRENILRIYANQGLEKAQKAATGLGLAPNYVFRLIHSRGIA